MMLLAGIQQRGGSDVIHHRGRRARHPIIRVDVVGLVADVQRAIASGNLDAVARAAAASLCRSVEAVVEQLPR
ncbi:MAG: hypothetical protein ACYDAC_00950 [Candidatus Dormibacteria bacterium]